MTVPADALEPGDGSFPNWPTDEEGNKVFHYPYYTLRLGKRVLVDPHPGNGPPRPPQSS